MFLYLGEIAYLCVKTYIMLVALFLTPVQWSVLCFLIVQIFAIIKFFGLMSTDIQILKGEMKDNNTRDFETRKEIESIRTECKENDKEISAKLLDIIQGLVRVEEKVNHIEKQIFTK